MTYFNTYPVYSHMGLRESIDAMLSYVAYNGHDFGYLPPALHESNYNLLLRDYEYVVESHKNTLKLIPKITRSDILSDLVDTLLGLCNNYPAYDDSDISRIEGERLYGFVEETRKSTDPDTDKIVTAIYNLDIDVEQNEYGANISIEDWEDAIKYAREN